MKTEVERDYQYGFVLSEQELRRIHHYALQQMKRVTREEDITEKYEVKYQNDLVTETSSFDEIFAESNGGKWEVQSVVINLGAKIDYDEPKISVPLNSPKISLLFRKGFRPIVMRIAGEDRDWVYLTSSHIEDRIETIKRTPFWNGQLWGLVAGSCMLFFVGFIVLSFLHLSAAARTLTILLALLCGLVAFSPFSIPYFFPTYNFCWGDYLNTFNSRKSLGNLIFFGVIGTIVLGIVASVIASLLTGGFSIH